MEAVDSSETFIPIYQITRCNIPEDSNLMFIVSDLRTSNVVHYCVQKGPPLEATLSPLHVVFTIANSYSDIHFNVIFP
jgi:hypothetical protein